MKAIETKYGGYRFRSRLEARWAVFFDALGIKYEYEKEGFDLGDGIWYLPDFWLPDRKCWIEIKPDYPNDTDLTKFNTFISMTQYPVFMCIGVPEIPEYDGDGWVGNTAMFECSGILNAVTAAKSARFEHGETPNKAQYEERRYKPFTDVVRSCTLEHGISYGRPTIYLTFTFENGADLLIGINPVIREICGEIEYDLRNGTVGYTFAESVILYGLEIQMDIRKMTVDINPSLVGKSCTFDVDKVWYEPRRGKGSYVNHWKLVKVV